MIRTVWLDNPPVNAVGRTIVDHLWSELDPLDPEVRAVVLRGRGDRAFSAGGRQIPGTSARSRWAYARSTA